MSPQPATHAETKPNWFDERLGLAHLRRWMGHKTVPLHSASLWYYFGGITLFLFVIQALTGILLLLYYRPSTTEAYESVQFIMARVKFGWLVRPSIAGRPT
jgi:Cytochrome b subunit of the bc complex